MLLFEDLKFNKKNLNLINDLSFLQPAAATESNGTCNIEAPDSDAQPDTKRVKTEVRQEITNRFFAPHHY